MKIGIVGPGAMGLLFGSLLAKAKEEVHVLDHDAKRASYIKKEGVKISGINNYKTHVDITSDPKKIGPCDLVVVCVKSYDTEDALKGAKELIGDTTQVLTLQNGVGNIQVLDETVGEGHVIGGITNQGATVLDWGQVRYAGKGETVIGKKDRKVLGPVREISRILNKAGFMTKVSKDINSLIWSKLIVNVGINALTAITRLNNGRLLDYEETRSIMKQAVSEAIKVAKRKRIKLIYDDPIQKVESVCKHTAKNVSSMLQDVLNKKKTEIDFINGAIVRQAKNLGIATPVNEMLTSLVKTIEASYDKEVTR